MTNPIKRFFEVLKAIILFPISFLQMRRAYQELGKMRKLPKNPEELQKFLRKMGLEDEFLPLFNPAVLPSDTQNQMNIVDLSYLDDLEEEDLAEEENFDEDK
ncbi:MAG: hypothetical protein ACTSRS_13295 [Candidatus Helarchaeota archaeon]